MARKREEEAAPGSPAWMATFSDLMNLLLCFFVLLFSMSSVDVQKFELIAASFSQTFSIFSAGSTAIGDGVLISNGVSQMNELDQYINSMGQAEEVEEQKLDALEAAKEEQLKESEALAEKIAEAIGENDLQKDVDIEFNSQFVQLTMRGSMLFDSGSAQLKPEALPTVQKISMILERYADSVIEVEGHTDNVPIHNAQYANNNVLSTFRALTIVDYLAENTNLDRALLKHSGRGEYVPVADNSTAEGRAKNRRVEIKIYHTLSSY